MLGDGHEDVRNPQRDLIQDFDALLNALENGAPNPRRLTPIQVTEQVREAAALPGATLESSGPEVVRLLTDAMPAPPQDLRIQIVAAGSEWSNPKNSFSVVVDRPKEDPTAANAFQTIRERMPAISEASRALAAESAARLLAIRRQMLIILASIAGLSIVLFAVGLLFTRRFIARPVRNLRTASQRI